MECISSIELFNHFLRQNSRFIICTIYTPKKTRELLPCWLCFLEFTSRASRFFSFFIPFEECEEFKKNHNSLIFPISIMSSLEITGPIGRSSLRIEFFFEQEHFLNKKLWREPMSFWRVWPRIIFSKTFLLPSKTRSHRPFQWTL